MFNTISSISGIIFGILLFIYLIFLDKNNNFSNKLLMISLYLCILGLIGQPAFNEFKKIYSSDVVIPFWYCKDLGLGVLSIYGIIKVRKRIKDKMNYLKILFNYEIFRNKD